VQSKSTLQSPIYVANSAKKRNEVEHKRGGDHNKLIGKGMAFARTFFHQKCSIFIFIF